MRDDDQRIFISIAAYRDPELLPTLDDCLAKARFPERLQFGICWQHAPDEAPLQWFADPRFRVLDVDWRAGKGACWARAEIMKLWTGEDWFLQLDSHHRFVENWDVKLIEQARATGRPKPILTSYVTPYTPGDPRLDDEPMRMEFDFFSEEGLVLFRPGAIPEADRGGAPVRARFLSAHFLFAPGVFAREVPYDPSLYFWGEEITLTVRAFTWGYDLFHPSEMIVWHEYTREHRTKHWDDNVETFAALDPPSRAKAAKFLVEPHNGQLGCGSVRTVADYEAYAGLSFRHRRSQDFTRRHFAPPNPPTDADWVLRARDWRLCVSFDADALPREAREDASFWYVGFLDAHGDEIFRKDADPDEIASLLAGDMGWVELTREFQSEVEPVSWVVWPHGKNAGWLEKLSGSVIDGRGEIDAPEAPCLADLAAAPERLAEFYPKSALSLIRTKVEGGFMVALPEQPEEPHFVNNTGALLLELANGRLSLSEIVDVGHRIEPPSPARKTEILQFFETAAAERLVRLTARNQGAGQWTTR